MAGHALDQIPSPTTVLVEESIDVMRFSNRSTSPLIPYLLPNNHAFSMSIAWEILEPYLVRLGAYSVPDPTYGRYTLPPHPPHLALINHPDVKARYRRVFLRSFDNFESPQDAYESTEIIHSEDVSLKADEIASGVARGGRWIAYSIWEMAQPSGKGVGRDLVLVHGLSDYGLRYAPHVLHHLKAGFRVILPDLPSYGRSTGVNSFLPSLALLPAALHAVLTDVVRLDLAEGRDQRKVFLSGASMGGWTVLYYVLKYPPTPSPISAAADSPPRVQVAGAFVMCPMVEASPESRPHYLTELAGRGIQYLAGTLPLAKSLRGKVSRDPRVEEDFFADPLCYHGWLRVATGFSLLSGMIELDKSAEKIDIPIRIIHGSSDRVTSHLGTQKLFNRLPNEDKQFEVYEGYEHVMLRIGHDEKDDEERQRVLADWQSWLLERC